MEKWVELGCGKTKQAGFIGVDRYPFEGVDIVADLNGTFPFEDSSVDVIYTSHALEHLDSLENTVKEMYRICRDNAICIVLVPYFNCYGNLANSYHKQQFNEHTFRFFTTSQQFLTQQKELELPSLYGTWGLGESDNSTLSVDIRTLDMEYIYFEEYNGLPEETKRVLRQNMNNICHMILYTLVVKKDGAAISESQKESLMRKRNEIVRSLPLSQLREGWEAYHSDRETVYSLFMGRIEQLERRLDCTEAEMGGGGRSEKQNRGIRKENKRAGSKGSRAGKGPFGQDTLRNQVNRPPRPAAIFLDTL